MDCNDIEYIKLYFIIASLGREQHELMSPAGSVLRDLQQLGSETLILGLKTFHLFLQRLHISRKRNIARFILESHREWEIRMGNRVCITSASK